MPATWFADGCDAIERCILLRFSFGGTRLLRNYTYVRRTPSHVDDRDT
jgi:hypothetical protein